MYIKIFKWLHKSITPSLYRQLPITFVCIHFITMRFTTFYARKCRDFCKIHNFYSLIGKFLWHVTIVNPFQYFAFTRRFSCEIAQWAVGIKNWFLRFQLQKTLFEFIKNFPSKKIVKDLQILNHMSILPENVCNTSKRISNLKSWLSTRSCYIQ